MYRFGRCGGDFNGNSTWSSDHNQAKEIVEYSSFYIYMLNNYIDLNDIDNPIKSNKLS